MKTLEERAQEKVQILIGKLLFENSVLSAQIEELTEKLTEKMREHGDPIPIDRVKAVK